jgi:carbon monoxide dehydrogenase subunit G
VQLTHSFRIPVPVDEAWRVLRDIERVAPCMPGATIDSVDGDDFTGGVKVKVGPITMTYKGEASFVDVDEEHHRAAIEAKGRETRGSGTAKATVQAQLRQDGDETEVTLVTDLAVTGKPAQFGRGVMADVGGKLIGQFADCLSSELAGTRADAPAAAAAGDGGGAAKPGGTRTPLATPPLDAAGTTAASTAERTGPSGPSSGTAQPEPSPGTEQPGTARSRRPSDEAIDLLGVAGTPLLKRVGPLLAGLVSAVAFLLWRLGRRGERGGSRRQRQRTVKVAKRTARAQRKVGRAERRTARSDRRVARAERRTAKAERRAARAVGRADRAVADAPSMSALDLPDDLTAGRD